MKLSKNEYIELFKHHAEQVYYELLKSKLPLNKKASEMNKQIKSFRDIKYNEIVENAKNESSLKLQPQNVSTFEDCNSAHAGGHSNKSVSQEAEVKISGDISDADFKRWSNSDLLDEILLMTYSSYIVMLEYRNEIWPYEYMAFSRRIGELWEPFCKLAFEFSVKKLEIIEPPKFSMIQEKIQKDAKSFIETLPLDEKLKNELRGIYEIPWNMVDSGGINMNLDLHFKQNGIHYNCDFKSGFSSNEKGNTNRLLLVASIFNFLGQNEKQILFVKQKESENNHYLQTLKNSNYWKIYCADDCYNAIKEFTGTDLKYWLNENACWTEDISEGLRNHLQKNDLLKYLTW